MKTPLQEYYQKKIQLFKSLISDRRLRYGGWARVREYEEEVKRLEDEKDLLASKKSLD